MTWIPAIAIGGAVLAAGPIAIHILFRRRYRLVDFAAIRFLLEGRRHHQRRLRYEEILLIALRVLACLLAGLVLANIRSAKLAAGRSAAVAHIIVLDDSLSMGQRVGTGTVFQKALTHVAQRLERMPDIDQVAILSASRPLSGLPLARLAPVLDVKRDRFAERLMALKPTDGKADWPAAVGEAAKLAGAQKGMAVRVYAVGDFRRHDVSGSARQDSLRKAFAALDPDSVDLVLLDFGLPCRHNVAVEGIALGRGAAVAGVPAPVRVTLRNTGTEAAPAGKLSVSVGDASLPDLAAPALSPGERADVEFNVTFEEPGPAVLTAAVPPDGLPGDDRLALALDVQDLLRILILDGSDDPAAPDSASHALAHALDPSGDGAFGRRVDVRAAEGWPPAGLDAYDLVILTNVREFPASSDEAGRAVYPALRAIEDYVRDGGGLALFAGDRISTAFYNGPLHADGKGLSPLPLLDRPLPIPDRERFVRLDPASLGGERLFRAVAGRGAAFSRLVRFYAYAPATGVPAPDAAGAGGPEVLAAFENGSPAVCRHVFGRGTVLMWYSSADMRWSSWPKDLTFLPVMNDMVWELARKAPNEFVDLVGRRIRYALPARLSGVTAVHLKTPAYPREDIQVLAVREEGRSRTVTYPEPHHAGCYELTLTLADRTERKVFFARRPDPVESDLTKAGESEIRAAVGRPHRYAGNLSVGSESAADVPPPRALWWYFMAALLAVLCAENLLALRFGHYQPRVLNAREQAP
jgi:hypothetical protein